VKVSTFEAVTEGAKARGAAAGSPDAFRFETSPAPARASPATSAGADLAAGLPLKAWASGANCPTRSRYDRRLARKALVLRRLGVRVKCFITLLGNMKDRARLARGKPGR
jgi:hypothetical protein